MNRSESRRTLVVGPAALPLARVLSLSGFPTLAVQLRFRKRPYGTHVVRAQMNSLPFLEESFSLIVLAGGLGSASSPVEGIQTLCRLLEPNGQLVVLSPEPEELFGRFLHSTSSLFRRNSQVLSRETVCEALLLAGLSHVEQSVTKTFLPILVTMARAHAATNLLPSEVF